MLFETALFLGAPVKDRLPLGCSACSVKASGLAADTSHMQTTTRTDQLALTWYLLDESGQSLAAWRRAATEVVALCALQTTPASCDSGPASSPARQLDCRTSSSSS